MFYVKKPKAVIIRLVIYLVVVVLISAGYWFSGKIRMVYLEINPDGTFAKTQLVREASWAKPLFAQTPPEFLIVDNRLYLRIENVAGGLFPSAKKKKNKTWNLSELHELRDKNPDLKLYLKDLPPPQESIPLKIN